ncbi:proline-, glutamic acid- and leucine-rich protein 1-like isoform X2 [Zingiber officinale]|uniref:proline-, glutamic acid- and leucine-rich protein 1-like isoform X2 n=1 Tax=Zingiber officinale TaxID=94328 RepID=UPI001C4CCBF5|nr:proline-, glutamic acid- and leucine-rich protein 1-like isoform X2 [Zingiber officinale]
MCRELLHLEWGPEESEEDPDPEEMDLEESEEDPEMDSEDLEENTIPAESEDDPEMNLEEFEEDPEMNPENFEEDPEKDLEMDPEESEEDPQECVEDPEMDLMDTSEAEPPIIESEINGMQLPTALAFILVIHHPVLQMDKFTPQTLVIYCNVWLVRQMKDSCSSTADNTWRTSQQSLDK